MKKTLGVVVLNYKNYTDTIHCVKSILEQIDISTQIVIVDNGSGNESVEKIKEQFSGIDRIQIIEAESNLGYAKGNNLGIACLRKQGIHNIFIANSDLILEDNCILSQLLVDYGKNVGILNPIIKNPDGTIDQRVAYKKKLLYLRLIRHILYWFIGKSVPDKAAKTDGSIEHTKTLAGLQYDRYVVSGSGFILTENFFEFYDGLYDKTFLYGEEMATILLLHKANLLSMIVSCPAITHKGGASTPINIRNNTDKRRRIVKESYKAILRLLFTPAFLMKRSRA